MKWLIGLLIALVCLLGSCTVFVIDRDTPAAPSSHDTTTVTIVN